jgi:hypothetical protein
MKVGNGKTALGDVFPLARCPPTPARHLLAAMPSTAGCP